jgi:DnaB-like helicase N terminal domain
VSYLTHRAERAVIGALLADPRPPDHLYGLRASDFSSRLHRELYTAVADLSLARPDLTVRMRLCPAPAVLTLDLTDLGVFNGICRSVRCGAHALTSRGGVTS